MTLIFYLTLFSKADLHGCEFLYLHIVILYLYIHTVDKVNNALMHPGSNGWYWKLKGCVSVVGQIQISLHLSKQISQLSLTFLSYFTMFCHSARGGYLGFAESKVVIVDLLVSPMQKQLWATYWVHSHISLAVINPTYKCNL